MKKLFALLLLSASLSSNAQSQKTDFEIAIEEFENADKELNRIYNEIVKEYKDEKTFVANLRKSSIGVDSI